jgi:hypothetical protein
MLTHIKWIPQLFIVLVLIGCATVQEDWEKAQGKNTAQAYQEFLKKHPASEWTDTAKQKMEEADWERAESLDIIQLYQEFLEKYPSSPYADIARRKTEKFDWSKAEKTNTVQAYHEFLAKHPAGEFSRKAGRNIEEIEWESAKNINTNASYEEFLKKYPSGEFARKALKEIKVPHEIIEKIPGILVYEGSDVFITYKISSKIIEVVYKDDRWRFVKSDVGYKVEPGKITIIGKARANAKLMTPRKGSVTVRGSIKYDKKGVPYADKDGAMLYIEEELK